MAIYPCAIGKHRYPQPQQTAYGTSVHGSSARTHKARLCPSHFRAVMVMAREHLALIEDSSQSSLSCDRCDEPKNMALFLRVFPAKMEEEVYAGDFCGTCGEALEAQLQIATWDLLSER